ncbi:hypothetical protein S83_019012, partial [Arachis hypogaea]
MCSNFEPLHNPVSGKMKRYRTTDFKISVLNSSFQRILLFFLEALRMPERLSSTLDQHLVCPIVTPSPTFVQRDGNLSVLEEEGIAKASDFPSLKGEKGLELAQQF